MLRAKAGYLVFLILMGALALCFACGLAGTAGSRVAVRPDPRDCGSVYGRKGRALSGRIRSAEPESVSPAARGCLSVVPE